MQVIKRIRRKLAGFINSVKENDGYYIARYEASGKAEQSVKSKRGQEVWTEINKAARCRNFLPRHIWNGS